MSKRNNHNNISKKESVPSSKRAAGKKNFIGKKVSTTNQGGTDYKADPSKQPNSNIKNKGFKATESSRDRGRVKIKKPPLQNRNSENNSQEILNGDATSNKNYLEKDSQDKIRLNKYISNSGVCSRRDADILIQDGEIKVNGIVITELGYKVNPGDVIKHGNKILNPEKPVYVLLNKPKDFITTMDDPEERKTVMNLVKNACKERIYPVGRLDRNTTGLLLLTNDGEMTKILSHPSGEVRKIYQVDLNRPLEEKDFEKIIAGLMLDDGPVKVDDIAIVSSDRKSIGIEIHEGRNRIVRRIFESLQYEVLHLDRVMYAGLTKKDLPRGNYRLLTPKEIIKLKGLRIPGEIKVRKQRH